MFNLDNYKLYLKNEVRNDSDKYLKRYFNTLSLDNVINALCDFEQTVYLSLNITKKQARAIINKLFDLTNKPPAVEYQNWFLFKFGFKKCRQFKKILPLACFGTNNTNWDKLRYDSKEAEILRGQAYRKINPEQSKLNSKTYRQNHMAEGREYNALKRYTKMQRTPKWLTAEHRQQLLVKYRLSRKLSKETGIKHHVDHLIPLQGEIVSGLHLPWNTEVLTQSHNCSKQNKFDQEYWSNNCLTELKEMGF
jgi:hypothetical protein